MRAQGACAAWGSTNCDNGTESGLVIGGFQREAGGRRRGLRLGDARDNSVKKRSRWQLRPAAERRTGVQAIGSRARGSSDTNARTQAGLLASVAAAPCNRLISLLRAAEHSASPAKR